MSNEIYNNIKIKNNVLFGKNNWLFLYNGGQKQFDYLLGEEIVNEKSIENFTNNIIKRTEIFESKNIDYLHVVFPSKPVVKKKYLPKKFNIRSVFKNYYEKPLLSNSNIIYPLSELLNLEKKQSTFHKYNTHNSDYGYFRITETIFNKLKYNIDLNEFIEDIEVKEVSGDLNKMISSEEKSKETFIKLKSNIRTHRISNRSVLKGNTNEINILHNFDSISEKRLLIFGDSFFQGTLKFLKLYFREIFFIRSSFIHMDIIENYSPDVVMTGNAERYMCNIESDNDANNFIMELYGKDEYKPNIKYLDALKACLSYKYYPEIYSSWIQSITNYELSLKYFEGLDKIVNKNNSEPEVILHEIALCFELSNDISCALVIRKKIENLIENKSFLDLQEKINSNSQSADILRDVALAFEKSGDISIAKSIMQKAHELRPTGPVIKQKLDEYKKIISDRK